MNDQIRFGIMSCASIVPRFVRGLEECGLGTAAVIASRSGEKAQKTAEDLISEIESAFKMRFKMKEVSGMKNVGELAEIVAERGTL